MKRQNKEIYKEKMKVANDNGINVIQNIPNDKNAEILDKEAIELLMKKAKEDGLIVENEERIKNLAGSGISLKKDGTAIIADFD